MSSGNNVQNNQEKRDVFKLANEVHFVSYTETFLGVIWTDMRAPKCLCPFHEDSKPSFSVKARFNRGKCFSCQDIHDPMISLVDFVAKVTGKKPLEAAQKICEDMGL